MCLTPITKEMKAEEDLLVYKCLDKLLCDKAYQTPYFYKRVQFEDGIALLEMDPGQKMALEKKVYTFGIHGYYEHDVAADTARQYYCSYGTRAFLAIIPKGTRYCLGRDWDVVAERLIIFKTEDDFRRYTDGKGAKTIEHGTLKKKREQKN